MGIYARFFRRNLPHSDVIIEPEVGGAVIIRNGVKADYESLTAAATLTLADSGKTFFLNLAAGFTVTLPSPVAGMKFEFIVATAPTTAYVIASHAADIIAGTVHESDGGDADSDQAGSTIEFVANTALLGDKCVLITDGTMWYATCFAKAAGGMTISG